jgi:hypothetical protein
MRELSYRHLVYSPASVQIGYLVNDHQEFP